MWGPPGVEPRICHSLDPAHLEHFMSLVQAVVDLNEISKISNEQILSSIPQICSFKVVEKQALLEANTLQDRLDVLISLLKMYTLEGNDNENETIN